MPKIIENHVEEAALETLAELGYSIAYGPNIAPDRPAAERISYRDVVLEGRLRAAVERINLDIPALAREDAIRQILRNDYADTIIENRRLHTLIVHGATVEERLVDGDVRRHLVRFVDFEDVSSNDWLAVNQFTVLGDTERRPDVVVFVNGLPIGIIELKNPGDEDATLDGAYQQLQTYKSQIPALFRTNELLATSDGIGAKVGSLTADKSRFMIWRTIDGQTEASSSLPQLDVLISGLFERSRLLRFISDFVVFGDTGDDTIKILAGYHQYHAALKGLECTLRATSPDGDRRIGVIWHTQGSGKSLLMAFYAGLVVKHPDMRNPTLVVVTDRNDLDDQLFATFCMCKDLLRQQPVRVTNRSQLRQELSRQSGGVIFTTIQKFAPGEDEDRFPLLTDRDNVVVIADEAHRSQYGFKAHINGRTGEMSHGFARHLRDAVPNASFIGFTGTPIEATDVNTPAVFGSYIDQYDIAQAVRDGATVPIMYESRLARVEMDQAKAVTLDDEIAEQLEGISEAEERKLSARLAGIEAVVGADERIRRVAADLVDHLEARLEILQGKAMVVCMSRRICVKLYEAIRALRPEWHDDADDAGSMKVVMTGSASDPQEWQPHIGKHQQSRAKTIALRAKDADDALKLVIVRDMWLTGFDAPAMHTMYVDKPMRGHGLMQAIARVNRVFKDKPAGLVVDYIGIAQSLRDALAIYSPGDRKEVGADFGRAVEVLQEKYEIVRSMFRPDDPTGFDYRPATLPGASGKTRLSLLAGAMDWILTMQQREAAQEQDEDKKRKAQSRYANAVLELRKATGLAASQPLAQTLAEETGFFENVRAALVKNSAGEGKSLQDRETAIRQIVSRAVISTDIVNILEAAGIGSTEISILSDDFLSEIREMKQENLAIEALRKLLNGEIRSQGQRNVTLAKSFSARLESTIHRYHNNAITTAEALEELIKLAKDFRGSKQRGEEHGLSPEEMAFYDALAENDSAVEALKEDKLRVMATLLVKAVRENATVDWTHRESARATMRLAVKRLLRKYGYPPDMENKAIQTVLAQAEKYASHVS